MNIKIAATNPVFPDFPIGQNVTFNIFPVGDGMYQLMHGEIKYIFEPKKTFIVNENSILIEGFITDNTNVGQMAFEFYSNENSEKSA
jgi:hypothetical protein